MLHYQFDSKILHTYESIYFCGDSRNAQDKQILFFLHGLGSSAEKLLFDTSINRYAEQEDIIIVLFNVSRSFYQNMRHGYNYENYFIDEVMNVTSDILNIKLDKTNTSISGFSMGGYGAFYLGFKYHHLFKCVSSISGSLDIVSRDRVKRSNNNYIRDEWLNIFGDKLNLEHDLFKSVKKDINIVFVCGRSDHLFTYNEKFHQHLIDQNISHLYYVSEGKHDMKFLDQNIIKIIKHSKEVYV